LIANVAQLIKQPVNLLVLDTPALSTSDLGRKFVSLSAQGDISFVLSGTLLGGSPSLGGSLTQGDHDGHDYA
jgi:hypothetical protein